MSRSKTGQVPDPQPFTAGDLPAGRFERQVVFLTGAASAIGRAAALAFAAEGALVTVTDLDLDGAQETAALIQAGGSQKGCKQANAVRCDVSDPQDVQETISNLLGCFGRLDCAFHHAVGSAGTYAGLLEPGSEAFDRLLKANLSGTWYCMQAELRIMLPQKSGAIVNTAPAAAGGHPALAAARGGIIQLTRYTALQAAAANVRINAICAAAAADHHTQAMPAEDIAAVVLYLCSRQAGSTTGQVLLQPVGVPLP